ncbi:MAG: hypothetical protein H7X86_01675 [Gorillibacterium sp.]|nr:hypothetical protein [Gorillibacterium sp.]
MNGYTWHRSSVGGGGFIPGLLQSPAQTEVMFARCDVAGVFRSDNRGKSFYPVNNGMLESSHHSVESFAISPHDVNILFRCSGEARNNRSFGFIHKSNDGGQSWRLVTDAPDYIGNGDARSMGEMIQVSPFDPSYVVAGSLSKGIYVSLDAGETWRCSGLKGEPIKAVLFHPSQPEVVYAGTLMNIPHVEYLYPNGYERPAVGRLYRSSNKGVTWELLCESESLEFMEMVFAGEDASTLVVASGKLGIHRSEDGGRTFQQSDNGLPKPGFYNNLSVSRLDRNCLYTAVDTGPGADHIPIVPLYSSQDGGKTWKLIKDYQPRDFTDYPYPDGDIRAIGWAVSCFIPDLEIHGRLYMSNWFGVSVSEDSGQSWSGNNYEGIENICLESIVSDPIDPSVFYFSSADKQLHMSRNDGASYSSYPYVNRPNNYYCSTAMAPSRHRKGAVLYGVTNNQTRNSALYLTLDYGKSVEVLIEWPQGLFVQALREDPFVPGAFYAYLDGELDAGAGLYRTEDWGTEWTKLPFEWANYMKTIPHQQHWVESELLSVVFYQNKNVCGTNQLLDVPSNTEGKVYLGEWTEGVFRSDDSGQNWRSIRGNLPFGQHPASVLVCIASDEKRPGMVYAGFIREGLWRSHDDGGHWEKVYPKDNSLYNASSIAIGGVTGDELYIACEPMDWSKCPSSVIVSRDLGKTWLEVFDPTMGAVRWKGIAVNKQTGTIQAISCGNGALHAKPVSV